MMTMNEEAVARATPFEWLENLLRYHETGGHEGDGSDHAMRSARSELAALAAVNDRMTSEEAFCAGWNSCAKWFRAPPGPITNNQTAMKHALKAAIAAMPAQGWRDITSAPKDGTEILAFRDDCGVLLVRWTAAAEFLTDAELDQWDEAAAHEECWFCADFITGCRLDYDLLPTHWQPLPAPPETK